MNRRELLKMSSAALLPGAALRDAAALGAIRQVERWNVFELALDRGPPRGIRFSM